MSQVSFEVPEIGESGSVILNLTISQDAKTKVAKLSPYMKAIIVDRYVLAFRELAQAELGLWAKS